MRRALALFSLIPAMALANSKPLPLSLTIRREMPTGLEQVSIVYRDDHVELVLNSNFAGVRQGTILLGHFKAPRNARADQLRELLAIEQAKLARRAEFREGLDLPPRIPEPHRRRTLVGNEELRDGLVEQELVDMLKELQSRSDWSAVDGVELVPDGKGNLTIRGVGLNKEPARTVPLNEVPCDVRPDSRDYCRISGYGGIYLD